MLVQPIHSGYHSVTKRMDTKGRWPTWQSVSLQSNHINHHPRVIHDYTLYPITYFGCYVLFMVMLSKFCRHTSVLVFKITHLYNKGRQLLCTRFQKLRPWALIPKRWISLHLNQSSMSYKSYKCNKPRLLSPRTKSALVVCSTCSQVSHLKFWSTNLSAKSQDKHEWLRAAH